MESAEPWTVVESRLGTAQRNDFDCKAVAVRVQVESGIKRLYPKLYQVL